MLLHNMLAYQKVWYTWNWRGEEFSVGYRDIVLLEVAAE